MHFFKVDLKPSFVSQLGELLIQKHHPAKNEIHQRSTRLMAKWEELLKASNDRGKGLEEARDILEFNEQVEKVEMWIREKVGDKRENVCVQEKE